MLVSTKMNQRLKHELSFNVMVLKYFTKVQHSFQFYSIFHCALNFTLPAIILQLSFSSLKHCNIVYF